MWRDHGIISSFSVSFLFHLFHLLLIVHVQAGKLQAAPCSQVPTSAPAVGKTRCDGVRLWGKASMMPLFGQMAQYAVFAEQHLRS